ncbi:MAG TPA: hypothetical protein VH092_12040, partial [Urbifossiella sp.]|nr:hypothetical protein [Urbifossiella sp.]
ATLTQALTKATDPFSLQAVALSLAAVAPRLEPAQSAGVAAALTKCMTPDHQARQELAQALAAVAGRMRPGEAAAALTRSIAGTNDAFVRKHLTRGLVAVAGRLEPGDAAAATATLTTALAQPNQNPFAAQELMPAFVAVAARLEPRAAAETIPALVRATSRHTDPPTLMEFEAGLTALVTRLEPDEAGRLGAEIVARLTRARTENRNDLRYLALWVLAVAGRLEAGPAAEAAATLAQGLTWFVDDAAAVRLLARAFSAAAGRMAPADAARVCSEAAPGLNRAVGNPKTNHPVVVPYQAEGLAAVAAHLEPAEAARVCGEAAAVLGKAVAGTTDPDALQYRVRGLVAVTARAQSKVASEAAATLMLVMARSISPQPTLAGSPAPDPLHTLSGGLTAILGRLSDQELVDLLKRPLCVGPARRAVLDQLGTRHRRAFADQWDFAHFAGENRLGLDLSSPLRLPARGEAAGG